MPLTAAWAKNVARRVLAAALSPEPHAKHRPSVAAFFDGHCAYCGIELPAKWHLDHLVSFDSGGSNHLANRVPSCPRCNEHEKRDLPWRDFLKQKCGPDERLLADRTQRIGQWVKRCGEANATVPAAARASYEREVAAVSRAIDESVARLKVDRNGFSPQQGITPLLTPSPLLGGIGSDSTP